MSVQIVTSDTTISPADPSVTIAKIIENADLTITLPDASSVVGQSFTVMRDTTGGRTWEWSNTNITTSLNSLGPLNGSVTSDGAHYFIPSGSSGGATLYKFNTATWAQEASVTTPSGGTFTDVIMSSDDSKLFVAVHANPAKVLVYSTSSLSLLQTITLSSDSSAGTMALSSDGTKLYCATSRGVVSIDTSSYAVTLLVSHTGSTNAMCISSTYIYLGYFASPTPNHINVYNLSNGAFVQAINYGPNTVTQFTFDPNGQRVWMIGQGSLVIVDESTLSVLFNKPYNDLNSNGSRIVMDTNNNLAYVGSSECVHVFDLTMPSGLPRLVTSLKSPAPSTTDSTPLARIKLSTNKILVQEIVSNNWFVVDSSQTIGDNTVNIATQSGQLIDGSSNVTLFSPDDARTMVAYWDDVSFVYAWAATSSIVSITQDANVIKLPKFQQQDFAKEMIVVQLSDGSLVGWGENTSGALCNGQTAGVSPPAPVLYDPLSTPDPHASIVDWALTATNLFVVFSDGSAYAGGQNAAKQLGDGLIADILYLKRVPGLPGNVNRVWASSGAAGDNGMVFYGTSDNKLYACGLNTNGQLGIGTLVNPTAPTLSWNSGAFTDVIIGQANGVYWTFLITASGGIRCTGYNGQGQLGLGNITQQSSWQVPTISGAGAILKVRTNGGYNGTTRYSNTMVLDSNGKIFATGSNAYGQLSQGNTATSTSFLQIALTSTGGNNPIFTDLGYGNGLFSTCWALTDVGSLWTWGYGAGNALFKSGTSNQLTAGEVTAMGPQILKVLTPAMNTATNSSQTIVLCSDGALKYSGNDNDIFGISDPHFVSGVKNVPAIPQMPFPQNEISEMFMHGTAATQRLFVLTKSGKIFALGNNTNAIVTGGVEYSTTNVGGMWYQIPLGRYQR